MDVSDQDLKSFARLQRFLVQELMPKLFCIMTFYYFYQLISPPSRRSVSKQWLSHSREIACLSTTPPLLSNCSMLEATVERNDIFTHVDVGSKFYDCRALVFQIGYWQGRRTTTNRITTKRPILVLSFPAKGRAGPRTNSELGDIIRCEKPPKMVHLTFWDSPRIRKPQGKIIFSCFF